MRVQEDVCGDVRWWGFIAYIGKLVLVSCLRGKSEMSMAVKNLVGYAFSRKNFREKI